MLLLMNENACQDPVQAMCEVATHTATEFMSKAADKVKTSYELNKEGIYNTAVSGEETWQKRGFSSSYGVVSVLPTITGKATVRLCQRKVVRCKLRRGKEGAEEFHQ